jgi:phosphoesterase RecJ-like protein
MAEKLLSFISRHDLFILTTHDPADADGIGAQITMACILRGMGKEYRILNASPIPQQFRFMDPNGFVEQWNENIHGTLPEQAAVIMLDTAELHIIGDMKDPVCRCREIFIIDHHDLLSNSRYSGICDSKAASTCELMTELAKAVNAALDSQAAFAAYTGIVYDTGFFAYQKTGMRSFQAALELLALGVNPNGVYRQLRENSSTEALLLQKKALAGLTLHCNGQVASQLIRFEDFAETGASPDDTDGLVNIPLRAREVVISLLIKENEQGKVRCSLRSKGTLDVSKIAHEFGGGGHRNAAGFRIDADVDHTNALALAKIAEYLEKQ